MIILAQINNKNIEDLKIEKKYEMKNKTLRMNLI